MSYIDEIRETIPPEHIRYWPWIAREACTEVDRLRQEYDRLRIYHGKVMVATTEILANIDMASLDLGCAFLVEKATDLLREPDEFTREP